MSIRNDLLLQILEAYDGTTPSFSTRDQLLYLIAMQISPSDDLLPLNQNGILSYILSSLGGSVSNTQSRNELLTGIVIATGGIVTSPNDRNSLLEDWLLSASPVGPVEPRWYWDMLSPSYAAFPEAVNIAGAFSHKLTGKFSSSSFHLLSNKNGAAFRVFLSGTSYNLFAGTTSNVLPVVSLGQTIRQSLETGVHTLEYGRDALGEWYVKVDGVPVGSTVNLYSDFVSYNTFGSEIDGSGVPAFNNYHWNHEITGVRVTGSEYITGELIIPFDEGYNDEHESLEESNNLIVRKVGDIAARYTQTMPS